MLTCGTLKMNDKISLQTTQVNKTDALFFESNALNFDKEKLVLKKEIDHDPLEISDEISHEMSYLLW